MPSQPISKVKQEAIFWLARRLPPCTELLPVISQSLERPLTRRERIVLRLHYLYCEYCLRYMKQINLMREAIRLRSNKISGDQEGLHSPPPPPAPALPADARERLKRALESGKQ